MRALPRTPLPHLAAIAAVSALASVAFAQRFSVRTGALSRLAPARRAALDSTLDSPLPDAPWTVSRRLELPAGASPVDRIAVHRDGTVVVVSSTPRRVYWFGLDGTLQSSAALSSEPARAGSVLLSLGPAHEVLVRLDSGALEWLAPGSPEGSTRRSLLPADLFGSTPNNVRATIRDDGGAQLLVSRGTDPQAELLVVHLDASGRMTEQRSLPDGFGVGQQAPGPDGCWWFTTATVSQTRSRLVCLDAQGGIHAQDLPNAIARDVQSTDDGRAAVRFADRVLLVDRDGQRRTELTGIAERSRVVTLAGGVVAVVGPAPGPAPTTGLAPLYLQRFGPDGERIESLPLTQSVGDELGALFADPQGRLLLYFNSTTQNNAQMVALGTATQPGWTLNVGHTPLALAPVAVPGGGALFHRGAQLELYLGAGSARAH